MVRLGFWVGASSRAVADAVGLLRTHGRGVMGGSVWQAGSALLCQLLGVLTRVGLFIFLEE